jgi:hypothetical protein
MTTIAEPPHAAPVARDAGWPATWPGGWSFDLAVGLAVAAAAVWQGIRPWRGRACGC